MNACNRNFREFMAHCSSRCNEGRVGEEAVNNPKPTGCNVIESISVLKFPQVQGSLQLARKVALDQIGYENEARVLKISKY